MEDLPRPLSAALAARRTVTTALEVLAPIDSHLEALALTLGIEPPWHEPRGREARHRREDFARHLRRVGKLLEAVDGDVLPERRLQREAYMLPPARGVGHLAPEAAIAMHERWADGLLDLCARDLRVAVARVLHAGGGGTPASSAGLLEEVSHLRR